MDVVGAEEYFPHVISRAEPVAAGSGPRSEGVGTARGAADCGGDVVAPPIPDERESRLWAVTDDDRRVEEHERRTHDG